MIADIFSIVYFLFIALAACILFVLALAVLGFILGKLAEMFGLD